MQRRVAPQRVEAVLAVIEEAARAGQVAPSNDAIAARVGLAFGSYVVEILAKAKAAGLLCAEHRGRRARVFAAPDGAWRTAPPKGWDSKSPRVTAVLAAPRQQVGVGIQNPEVSLAAAVVMQAWDDLVRTVGHRYDETNRVRPCDKADAIAFCTAAGGPWADARVHWCLAAGIDPDVFRQRALARRHGGDAIAPKGSAVAERAAEGAAPVVGAEVTGVSSRNSAGRGQPWPAAFSGVAA